MRKLVLAMLPVLLALGCLATSPRPAAASDVGCGPLQTVNISGSYETVVRMCQDWSSDHQSIRARMGIEFRHNGVRATVGRLDLNNLWLAYNGSYVRQDDLGVIPAAPNYMAGTTLYGSWYNDPGVCGLHHAAYAIQLGNAVRYISGANPTLASLSSPTVNWDYSSCS